MCRPQVVGDAKALVEELLSRVGNHIVLAIPLGLGKPIQFVNALYRRAERDPSIELEILTALTLEVPAGSSLLERRFFEPFCARVYEGYEPPAYASALREGSLPPNVNVSEFYFQPGAYLGTRYAQQHYLCANYSRAAQALIDRGVNVVAQLVARRGSGSDARFSLGSNSDMTLDLSAAYAPDDRPLLVAEVCRAMPFMLGHAETPASFWNIVLDDSRHEQQLFKIPNEPVALPHYAIAVHVASIIKDAGTLQIGIGSLADAVTHMIRIRQENNPCYRSLVNRLIDAPRRKLRETIPVEVESFKNGLYGCSEMFVEGFLNLVEAGVLKRRVNAGGGIDSDRGVFLHAAFFLGSGQMYEKLRNLPEELLQGIDMSGVRFVNTLDDDFELKCSQRSLARFVNSAMMVTINGAVVSDGLEDGRVVSGVGGQHDFVAMAQSLPEARSIIMLPSTRTSGGQTRSNIVFNYGHTTIPRHFRDIVVTEYGAADLRGKTDHEVIAAMLNIADSRFQASLLKSAKKAGKVDANYRIPDHFARNIPDSIEAALTSALPMTSYPHFPTSTDFSNDEARLAVALQYLKVRAGSRKQALRMIYEGVGSATSFDSLLDRMRLRRPKGFRERIYRRLLLGALHATENERSLLHAP